MVKEVRSVDLKRQGDGVAVLYSFKQKTAYDIRPRDWSSDVCSSDLLHPALPPRRSCERAWSCPTRSAPQAPPFRPDSIGTKRRRRQVACRIVYGWRRRRSISRITVKKSGDIAG